MDPIYTVAICMGVLFGLLCIGAIAAIIIERLLENPLEAVNRKHKESKPKNTNLPPYMKGPF